MRSNNHPPARTYSRRNQNARRFISRPWTFLLVLLSMGMTIVLSSVLADAGIERFLHKDFGNYRPATLVKRDRETPNEKHSDLSDEMVETDNASALLQRLQAGSFSALAQNNDKRRVDPEVTRQEKSSDTETRARYQDDEANRKPKEQRLIKARSFNGDLRDLPYRRPVKRERPEREGPEPNPGFYPGTSEAKINEGSRTASVPAINAPAPRRAQALTASTSPPGERDIRRIRMAMLAQPITSRL